MVLQGTPALWRLVATWPQVRLPKTRRNKVVAKWARVSGVRDVEVETAWDTLFANGICRRDGTVDPVAAEFVKAQIARGLRLGRLPAKPTNP